MEVYFDMDVDGRSLKVHVQIDEKFIGMTGSANKRRYYTLTIFAGKEPAGRSHRLLNKTVISSANLCELKRKLNDSLKDRYKVSPNEEVFVSGDFAAYIRNFGESITCCKAKYVPDRFHVYKALRDSFPDLYVDDHSLNDVGFRSRLVGRLGKMDDENAKKLRKIMLNRPDAFATYLDPDYLGCSQKGQNSHIYAPRFGKYANRFSPSTIEKLSLLRETRAMGAKVVLVHKRRKIHEPIDISMPEPYEDMAKYALNTRDMKYETAKLFNEIKYGVYNGGDQQSGAYLRKQNATESISHAHY